MKRLAGLQIVLGILAAFDCWNLSIVRKYSSPLPPGNMVIPTTSPSYYGDAALVYIGLAILAISLLLRAKKGRLATLQVILGQDVAIISFILYRMALDNNEYIRSLNWVIYFVMAKAMLVIITGIYQFVQSPTRKDIELQ